MVDFDKEKRNALPPFPLKAINTCINTKRRLKEKNRLILFLIDRRTKRISIPPTTSSWYEITVCAVKVKNERERK